MQLGTLQLYPAIEHLDDVSLPTKKFLSEHPDIAEKIYVALINPDFTGTAEFCAEYQVSAEQTANTVILEATRGDRKWFAVCLILGATKADVNGTARRHLDARRVSFASREQALAETGMEYGGITIVGLPTEWPILVDSRIVELELVVMGSGVKSSKLVMPGKVVAQLPNVVVLDGLGR